MQRIVSGSSLSSRGLFTLWLYVDSRTLLVMALHELKLKVKGVGYILVPFDLKWWSTRKWELKIWYPCRMMDSNKVSCRWIWLWFFSRWPQLNLEITWELRFEEHRMSMFLILRARTISIMDYSSKSSAEQIRLAKMKALNGELMAKIVQWIQIALL